MASLPRGKFCPFFFAVRNNAAKNVDVPGGGFMPYSFECLGQSCAWFDGTTGSCAILLLAKSICKLVEGVDR